MRKDGPGRFGHHLLARLINLFAQCPLLWMRMACPLMAVLGRKSPAARRRAETGQQQLFHNWSLDYLQQAPISKFLG